MSWLDRARQEFRVLKERKAATIIQKRVRGWMAR
jgi:hypothetical protein